VSSGIPAALAAAAHHGLGDVNPRVLQDTNNTVVWLRPHPVVAKVATGKQTRASVIREREVCEHLVTVDAPVRPPWRHAPIYYHGPSGHVVSLWEYLQDSRTEIKAATLAASIKDVHRGLASYPSQLPSFRDALTAASEVLSDEKRLHALADADRTMLRSRFFAFLKQLDAAQFVDRPVHGEPHLGNVISTPHGPRWIDFEAVATGPLEWDLAFLDDDAVALFDSVDFDLLAVLRPLNSARVAIWCWARSELPGMRWHAEHHLEVVRNSTA
jgi:hypothetical protein